MFCCHRNVPSTPQHNVEPQVELQKSLRLIIYYLSVVVVLVALRVDETQDDSTVMS